MSPAPPDVLDDALAAGEVATARSRVAVLSPVPVLVAGLTAMLEQHPDHLEVVATGGPDEVDGVPDVVLYDAIGLHEGDGADLARLVEESLAAVLVVSQDLRPDLAARALALGADGFFSLGIDDEHLLGAVLRARGLEPPATTATSTRPSADADDTVERRLGRDVGLTPREVDVLTLVTQGLSNQEIAETCYLSINSVKTYIRSAYRRIGATSRSQAVVWCLQHGFATERPDAAAPGQAGQTWMSPLHR